MEVDASWHHDHASCIDRFDGFGIGIKRSIDHSPLMDPYVADAVKAVGWVDDAAASDFEVEG